MGDRADGFGTFQHPGMAAAQHFSGLPGVFNARHYSEAVKGSAPARLGERHCPPACFSIEADCRAAFAALQPDRGPAYPSQHIGTGGGQYSEWEGSLPSGAGVTRGQGGSYDSCDALPPVDKMHEDGRSAGGPAAAPWAGPPYAPQSTERRRRPRRKWDASVNYERITRRLELRFDAVAAEAPTTPPAQHPPQTPRPAARVLSFAGAGIEPVCSGSPGECGRMQTSLPGYQQLDAARATSGMQARRSIHRLDSSEMLVVTAKFAMEPALQRLPAYVLQFSNQTVASSAQAAGTPALQSCDHCLRYQHCQRRQLLLQGRRSDATVGASALELAQLRLGGGHTGGVTLFAALAALGGTVDEDAMRNVIIGAALGLQVSAYTCSGSVRVLSHSATEARLQRRAAQGAQQGVALHGVSHAAHGARAQCVM